MKRYGGEAVDSVKLSRKQQSVDCFEFPFGRAKIIAETCRFEERDGSLLGAVGLYRRVDSCKLVIDNNIISAGDGEG